MIPVLGSGAPTTGDADSIGTAPGGRTNTGSGSDFGQVLGTAGVAQGAQRAPSELTDSGGNGGNPAHSGGNVLPVAPAQDASGEADAESAAPGGFVDVLLAPFTELSTGSPAAAGSAPLVRGPAASSTRFGALAADSGVATGELASQAAVPPAQQISITSIPTAVTPSLIPPDNGQSPAPPPATSVAPGVLVSTGDSVALTTQVANTAPPGAVAAEVLRSGSPAAAPTTIVPPGTSATTPATDAELPPLLTQGAPQAESRAADTTLRASPEPLHRNVAIDERLSTVAQTVTANAARVDAEPVAETLGPNGGADTARTLTAATTTSATSPLAAVAPTLSAPLLDTAAVANTRAATGGAIPAHPGEPAWSSDVAGRVSLMMRNGNSEASLQLNPPELGRLDIKIATDGDAARVLFTVQGAETRDLLEQAMPRLREMLEESGLSLSSFDVADQSSSERDAAGGFEADLAGTDPEPEADSGPRGTLHSFAASQALVDYYV